MSHYKRICSVCGTMITQCRCPSPNKTIEYGICNNCKTKRCEVTGNIVGTDTYIQGHPCKCKVCRNTLPNMR